MPIDDRSPFIGRRCIVFRGKLQGEAGKVVSVLSSDVDGGPCHALILADDHHPGIPRTIRVPWSCIRLDKVAKVEGRW